MPVVEISTHPQWLGFVSKLSPKSFSREKLLYKRARLAGLLAVKSSLGVQESTYGTVWITAEPANAPFAEYLLAEQGALVSEGTVGFFINEFGDSWHFKMCYAEAFVEDLYRNGLTGTQVESASVGCSFTRECCKAEIRRASNGSPSTSGNGSETEESRYERDLPNDVVLHQPSDLSLADQVHRLDPLNRARPNRRSETPDWLSPAV